MKTPVRAPKANAYCERLIGTMRRQLLDFIIPLSERHLRSLLKQWVAHYHQARPHSSLGPGIPGVADPTLPRRSDRDRGSGTCDRGRWEGLHETAAASRRQSDGQ